jgi:hypothetical protein
MRTLPSIAAIAIAILGGVFFGLFSCGGYLWHQWVFLAILSAVVIIALLVPWRRKRPVLSRLTLLIVVIGANGAALGLSAPFYPAPPISIKDYGHRILLTLEYGAC